MLLKIHPSNTCIHGRKRNERDVERRSCENPNLTGEYTTDECPGLHSPRSRKPGNNCLMRITTFPAGADKKEKKKRDKKKEKERKNMHPRREIRVGRRIFSSIIEDSRTISVRFHACSVNINEKIRDVAMTRQMRGAGSVYLQKLPGNQGAEGHMSLDGSLGGDKGEENIGGVKLGRV